MRARMRFRFVSTRIATPVRCLAWNVRTAQLGVLRMLTYNGDVSSTNPTNDRSKPKDNCSTSACSPNQFDQH